MDHAEWLEPGLVNENMTARADSDSTKYGLPFGIALLSRAFKTPGTDLALHFQRHPSLTKFLHSIQQQSNNIPIHTNRTVTPRPVRITAGDNSHLHLLYSVSDVRFGVFESNTAEPPSLAQRMYAPPYKIRDAIGDIEVGICLDEQNANSLVVTNGQAQQFWTHTQAERSKLKKWYQSTLEHLVQIARVHANIKRVLIPTNQLMEQTLKANSIDGHTAPSSVLDMFYSRFSEKRGGTPVSCTLKHPVNGSSVEGDFYEMPGSFGQEALTA